MEYSFNFQNPKKRSEAQDNLTIHDSVEIKISNSTKIALGHFL